MKINLTFKTPDIMDQVVEEVGIRLQGLFDGELSSKECMEAAINVQDIKSAVRDEISKWLIYDEMIQVEYDTETDRMTVVKP
jgi:hypothetical protein